MILNLSIHELGQQFYIQCTEDQFQAQYHRQMHKLKD